MKSTHELEVLKIDQQHRTTLTDNLAVEEPVEIRLIFGIGEARKQQSISITMRTPGNDEELACGFLLTEGIIRSAQQITKVYHQKLWNGELDENIIVVEVDETAKIDLKKLERHFYTTSSCGVCGKSSIEAVHQTEHPVIPTGQPVFDAQLIHQLPERLRAQQAVFDNTGGLHAAALFNNQGTMHLLREDVGRHNAVDKLIGAALQQDLLPLYDYLIMVSGRASFELIQKSLMAGIPILAAVGAPSSLAVQLATASGMSVLGFVRDGRFNVYCHRERIQ